MKRDKNSRLGRPARRNRRRGSLYIAVLGTSLIVSMIALFAMYAARLHLRSARSGGDRHQARLAATSAIEHAITEFRSNANWQTDYSLATEYPSPAVSVAGGTFSWKLEDSGDGSRRLDGIGRVGDAECTYSVDLNLASQDMAMLVGGDLSVENWNSHRQW